MLRVRTTALPLAHQALRSARTQSTPVRLAACRCSFASSSAVHSTTAAAAASAAPPPLKPSSKKKNVAQNAPASATLAAPPSLPTPPLPPPTAVSSTLLPSVPRGVAPPHPALLLSHLGLVRSVGSGSGARVAVQPLGRRLLSKLEERVDAELAQFDLQPLSLDSATADATGVQTHPQPRHFSYPAHLSSLPLLTDLVVDDLRSGSMRRAALSASMRHPPASEASSRVCWPYAKTTREVGLFDTGRRSDALAHYEQLLDSLLRVPRSLGVPRSRAVECGSHAGAEAGVDADLAHQVHVETPQGGAAALLCCDKCEYAALPQRAISNPAPTATIPSAPSTTSTAASPPSPTRDAALESTLREWTLSLLADVFAPSVRAQLRLEQPDSAWKVELVHDATAVPQESHHPDDPLPLLYVVLLRKDDTVNLDSLGEHVGVRPLRAVSDPTTIRRILAQFGVSSGEDDAEPASPSPASFGTVPALDPTPELLLDQALLPRGFDLDLAEMDAAQEQEDAAGAEDQLQHDADQPDGDIALDSASPSSPADDDPVHARLESSLSSRMARLRPGEGVDLVALEAAARGLDPAAEAARLAKEAREAQRQEYEASMREQELSERAQQMAQRIDEEDEISFDPSSMPEPIDGHASPLDSEPDAASLVMPHYEYSRQGHFRRSVPGDCCAVCSSGRLRSVRTTIVAHSVFVGRQQLGEEPVTEQPPRKWKNKNEPAPAPRKRYLHTSYARLSPSDLLAALVAQSYAPARSSASPSAPLASDSVTSLHLPPLVAPFQIALLPVTAESGASANAASKARDRFRTQASTPEDSARLLDLATRLHDDIVRESERDSSLSGGEGEAEDAVPFSYPSVRGELLLDDALSQPTTARVRRAAALGVPILLLFSSSSLAKGHVTLLLNKKGVPLEPRRLAIDGLPKLLTRMVRSNYNAIVQHKRELKKKEQERQAMLQQAAKLLEQGMPREMQGEADEGLPLDDESQPKL